MGEKNPEYLAPSPSHPPPPLSFTNAGRVAPMEMCWPDSFPIDTDTDSDSDLEDSRVPTPLSSVAGASQFEDLPPSYEQAQAEAEAQQAEYAQHEQHVQSTPPALEPDTIQVHRLVIHDEPPDQTQTQRHDPNVELTRLPSAEMTIVRAVQAMRSTFNDIDMLKAPGLPRPIAIPQHLEAPGSLEHGEDADIIFARAYSPPLRAYRIDAAAFAAFLDGLNAVCSFSFNVSTSTSNSSAATLSAPSDDATSPVGMYLARANMEFFEPRRLQVRILDLERLLDALRISGTRRSTRDALIRDVLQPDLSDRERVEALDPWVQELVWEGLPEIHAGLVPRPRARRVDSASSQGAQSPEADVSTAHLAVSGEAQSRAVTGLPSFTGPPPFMGPPPFTGPPHFAGPPPFAGPSPTPGFFPRHPGPQPGFLPRIPPIPSVPPVPWARTGGCSRTQTWDQWGEDMGKRWGAWGEEFGKRWSVWGEGFGKRAESWGKSVGRAGENLGKGVEARGEAFSARMGGGRPTMAREYGRASGSSSTVGSAGREDGGEEARRSFEAAAKDKGRDSKSGRDHDDKISSDSESYSGSDSDSDSEIDEVEVEYLKRTRSIEERALEALKKGKHAVEDIEREREKAIVKARADRAKAERKHEAKLKKNQRKAEMKLAWKEVKAERSARRAARKESRDLPKDERKTNKRELKEATRHERRLLKEQFREARRQWKEARREERTERRLQRRDRMAERREARWGGDQNAEATHGPGMLWVVVENFEG